MPSPSPSPPSSPFPASSPPPPPPPPPTLPSHPPLLIPQPPTDPTTSLPISISMSTRGQSLPSLIRARSSNASLTGPGSRRPRRTSAWSLAGDGNDRVEEGDLERGVMGGEEGERGGEGLQAQEGWRVMRSMRLIGTREGERRVQWEKYYKSDEELKRMKKPIRKYYERNNYLISSYLYIDRLLDSSLPHSLIQEYYYPPTDMNMNIPQTISEEDSTSPDLTADDDDAKPISAHSMTTGSPFANGNGNGNGNSNGNTPVIKKVKRTPKALYKVPDESTPLIGESNTTNDRSSVAPVQFENPAANSSEDSDSPVVTVAIYINLAANTILLAGKIAVIVLTSSLSVLASLVDAALDFLSTAIVWTTTKLISRRDQYSYPVGRRRLEPIGVLVFSVIMITSFFQVSLQCLQRLTSSSPSAHSVVHLTLPATLIMASTVLIKLGCYFWCRLIRNSSVQALAQDALTDVVFNIFSILFPLVGSFFQIWWFDALGGLLLSLYVILNWSRTSSTHIRNLTGAAASATDRNILLYLTMRFAGTIRQIQGLQAYHAGDKLIVEVDIVLDAAMTLRDSHDLGESLQYVLESVPNVDRAFVHMDYKGWNLPTHMQQQDG